MLTHDPGMYPKRLILDDARQFGIAVLGLDVNASGKEYAVERVGEEGEYGIRLALAEVKGISEAEVDRIVAARPFHSLTDLWHRAQVSRPVLERLVLAGAFDSVYGIGSSVGVRPRRQVTRRDLLLQVAELDRHARAVERAGRGRGLAGRKAWQVAGQRAATPAQTRAADAAARNSTDPRDRADAPELERHPLADQGVWAKAAAQSKATRTPRPVTSVQLTLDLGDEPGEGPGELASGLPEMSDEERMKAELEILGLDASRHVVDSYAPFFDALGVTRSKDLLSRRSKAELLVAGRQGRHPDPADPVRPPGHLPHPRRRHRTGRRDVLRGRPGPLRRHGLPLLAAGGARRAAAYRPARRLPPRDRLLGAARPVRRLEGRTHLGRRRPHGARADGRGPRRLRGRRGGGGRRRRRGVAVHPAGDEQASPDRQSPTQQDPAEKGAAGGMGRRRVLVHSSGFKMSPYSDIKPAGEDTKDVARKLWHRSPGSAG